MSVQEQKKFILDAKKVSKKRRCFSFDGSTCKSDVLIHTRSREVKDHMESPKKDQLSDLSPLSYLLPSSTTASPYRSLPSTPMVLCNHSIHHLQHRHPILSSSDPLHPSLSQSECTHLPESTPSLGIPFPLSITTSSRQPVQCYDGDADSCYYEIRQHVDESPPRETPQPLEPLHSKVIVNEEQASEPEIVTPQLLRSIVFLGFLNIFIDTAVSSSLIPILPRELGQDEVHDGLVLAFGAVTASLLGPICGWLSDACGWSTILVWFYPLSISSAILMLFSHKSFGRFLIARLIAGAASGFMYPSNLSMVVQTHDPTLRSTAVGLTLAGDVGSLAGPLIFGGFLYDYGGLTIVFSFLIALCIFSTLAFFIICRYIQPPSPSVGVAFQPSTETNEQDHSVVLSQPFLSSSSSYPKLNPNVVEPLVPAHDAEMASTGTLISKSLSDQIGIKASETPSIASTRDVDSDVFSFCSVRPHSSSLVKKSSLPKMTFIHGSPPPPYIYNLHPEAQRKLQGEELASKEVLPAGFFRTLGLRLDELKVFATIGFLSRCLALFYCWGVALSLQAILPLIWDRQFGLSPLMIGVLFAPHLILRVSVSAFFPFFSVVAAIPLGTLISLGLLICTTAVITSACVPEVSPTIDSILMAFVGVGLGSVDGCITAWAGSADFENPSASSILTTSRDVQVDTISEAYRGRAFALLALSCDLGMFITPIFASLLSQYLSFSVAFGALGVGGICLSGLNWLQPLQ